MITSIFLFFSFLFPSDSDTSQFSTPAELIKMANGLHNEQKYEEAIVIYKSILPQDTAYIEAQSELMGSYNASGEYEKCLEIGKRLKDQPSKFRKKIYLQYGSAYINKEEYDSAKAVYQEAIGIFPYDYNLIYNLGFTHYRLGENQEALTEFQRSARINPFYGRNHILLGYLSALQGNRSKALLSYMTYLAINPDDNSILVFINNLSGDAFRLEGSLPSFDPNDDFEHLDQLLRSRAALDERFKTEVDFNADIVKQAELMFSELIEIPESNDFWVDFYLPFYRELQENGYGPGFLYFILKSTKKEPVTNWLEKNEKVKAEWAGLANRKLKDNRKTLETEVLGVRDLYSLWFYDSNDLSAIGNKLNEEVRTGPWEFYNKSGQLNAEGIYNGEGKKIGQWKYYHENGRLSGLEKFDPEGNFTEPAEYYFEEGGRSIKVSYKGTTIDGPVIYYNKCGSIRERLMYEDGLKNGDGIVYHNAGAVRITYTYEKDSLSGPYTIYFKNGQIEQDYAYKSHKMHGPFHSFYEDGSENETGQYENGDPEGKWKGFHPNGVLRFTGEYADGERQGKWIFYYSSGTMSEVLNYEDGKLKGEYLDYRFNGSLKARLGYEQDSIISLTSYDAKENILFEAEDPGGNMDYKLFYGTGEIERESTLVNGKLNGPYTKYFRSGKVSETCTMKDNFYTGPYKDYFNTGQLKVSSEFSEGRNDGYFRQFYKNGQLKQEGWYVDGNAEQEWKSYHPNGFMSDYSYFINDKTQGNEKTFDLQGRIYRSYEEMEGLIIRISEFDTLGKIFNQMEIDENGKMEVNYTMVSGETTYRTVNQCGDNISASESFYPDGTLHTIYPREGNLYHGEYISRYEDGTVSVRGEYRHNWKSGPWYWYSRDGGIESESEYYRDNRLGKTNYYYSNGEMEQFCENIEGKTHGKCEYFDHRGNLQVVKLYDYDDGFLGVISPGGDTTLLNYQGKMTLKCKFSNGKVSYLQTLQDGYLEGPTIYYNTDGSKTEEIKYSLNDLVGLTRYHDNGKIFTSTEYKVDLVHGVEKEYFRSGDLRRTTSYKFGEKSGWEIIYNKEGKIISQIWYRNDTIY